MEKNFDLSESLKVKLTAYLEEHPEVSFEDIVKDALKFRKVSKNPKALLKLAGIVTEADCHAAEKTEDKILEATHPRR